MNRVVPVLLFISLITGSAHANICAHDQTPAATLLFPFVVFDYSQPWSGETTILSVTNVYYEAQIVHVVLWSDIGKPVLEFNLVLSGYDTVRFNIRDILLDGLLPITRIEMHDDHEGVMEQGPVSEANEAAPSNPPTPRYPESTDSLGDRCSSDAPGSPTGYSEPIPLLFRNLMQLRLTASQTASFFGSDDCTAPFWGPYEFDERFTLMSDRNETSPTWLFATADVVHRCANIGPEDAAYWRRPVRGGQLRHDNVLTGSALWVSPERSSAMPAVHIEADPQLAAVATTDPTTGLPISFHSRYSNSVAGLSDHREPLPTAWAFTYLGAKEEHPADTSILVWKGSARAIVPPDINISGDPLAPNEIVATSCNAYTNYTWDDDSNVIGYWEVCSPPNWNPPYEQYCVNRAPLMVQEIPIGVFETVDESGWMLFVWPESNYPPESNTRHDPGPFQTWMGVRVTAGSTHAAYLPATVMANANCFADQNLPHLGVNYDYVRDDGYVSSH